MVGGDSESRFARSFRRRRRVFVSVSLVVGVVVVVVRDNEALEPRLRQWEFA